MTLTPTWSVGQPSTWPQPSVQGNLCVCSPVCVQSRVCMCMCLRVCVFVWACMWKYICVCVCVHACIRACAHECALSKPMKTWDMQSNSSPYQASLVLNDSILHLSWPHLHHSIMALTSLQPNRPSFCPKAQRPHSYPRAFVLPALLTKY